MVKVSVLTPIYNTKPAYLREMIESILNQTFENFEFLILNDSPDNQEIEQIVLDYANHDTRIKYIKNDKNMGITPSRNKLLKMAQGEYVAIFDHDDISVPNRLECQVKYLDSNPDIGVVSGWLEFFGLKNNVVKIIEKDDDIRVNLTMHCTIPHTAAMIRKSVLDDNNIQYEEYYTPSEDYCLWARLMRHTKFHNLQMVLVKYRWNGENTTCAQGDKMAYITECLRHEIQNEFPAYHNEYLLRQRISGKTGTTFRLRLFGFIPFVKIKNNWVVLFEFLPVCKLRWK